MSEFFKAAVKCDVRVAKAAPMYIDQVGIMEEQFRHERLVEQTLKTKLFLDELDAAGAAEADSSAAGRALSGMRATAKDVDTILGSGVPVEKGLYRDPPMSEAALVKPPWERNEGSRALERSVVNSLSLWRKSLDDRVAALQQKDKEEAKKAKEEELGRRRDAERELNALIASRQLTAHEAEKEMQRAALERARQSSRVHPIDVLQKRIAADLLDEMEEGSRIVKEQLEREEKGVDEIRELERLAEIRYKYHSPIKHIPTPW